MLMIRGWFLFISIFPKTQYLECSVGLSIGAIPPPTRNLNPSGRLDLVRLVLLWEHPTRVFWNRYADPPGVNGRPELVLMQAAFCSDWRS